MKKVFDHNQGLYRHKVEKEFDIFKTIKDKVSLDITEMRVEYITEYITLKKNSSALYDERRCRIKRQRKSSAPPGGIYSVF